METPERYEFKGSVHTAGAASAIGQITMHQFIMDDEIPIFK
jgi:hypothetical protein